MNRPSNSLAYEDSRRARSSRRGDAVPSSQRRSTRGARAGRPAPAQPRRSEFDLAHSRTPQRNHPSWYSAEDSERAVRQRQASRAAVSSSSQRPGREEGGSFGFFSGLSKKKAKERAGRKYERQFGGSAEPSAPQGGPRAAVYRAEMGSSHKRSSRMQGNPGQEAVAGATRSKQKKSSGSFMRRPVLFGTMAVLACLLAAGVFLYPTAQTYYQSLREYDRLEAEYAAVTQRNQELQDRLTSLSTDEGVAAYVHDRYGWVCPGENAVVVRGLTDQTGNAMSDLAANIPPGSVKAPVTWYSPVLDAVFGLKQ